MRPQPTSSEDRAITETTVGLKDALDARLDRALITRDGHVLIFGWAADEGSPCQIRLIKDHQTLSSGLCLLRHAHVDVSPALKRTAYDFGYAALMKVSTNMVGSEKCLLSSGESERRFAFLPELISEKRFLEEVLAHLGSFHAFAGREAMIADFLERGGRAFIADMADQSRKQVATVQHSEQFGPLRTGSSFVTVLYGSVESVMFQPLLFSKAGISFREWIYVCNSPEQANDVVRLARSAANLHDLSIRVVVLKGNAGFGCANNLAIGLAASSQIVLVNPDVHPIVTYAPLLGRALGPERFGKNLRGGLLFYDDEMLMHGGMYLDEDVFLARDDGGGRLGSCRLLRVEHYDKGVPFKEKNWPRPRPVPAVTGAVMAFERAEFEALGGFSDEFIFGHYEDADLCLRWRERVGPVEVDPDIRLTHLEGLGSKTRLPHFHGAAIVNRHAFERRNRRFADASRKHGSTLAT